MNRFGLAKGQVVYVFASLVIGCQELTPEARQMLTEGVNSYEKAEYNSATTKLSQFIDKNKEAPEVAEAHYIRGLCQLKLSHRSEARRDFEVALQRASRKDLIARAQACLAVMAYDDGNWATAANYYGEALPWIEDIHDYDDHLLRHGISLQRLGQWEPSRQVFARILHKYPNGAAAKSAKTLMGWNRPYFTVQCHALSKPDAAANEVARLRKLGLDASQQMETRQGQALYLVQVGQYKTYDEALQALERIKRHVPGARVVP